MKETLAQLEKEKLDDAQKSNSQIEALRFDSFLCFILLYKFLISHFTIAPFSFRKEISTKEAELLSLKKTAEINSMTLTKQSEEITALKASLEV